MRRVDKRDRYVYLTETRIPGSIGNRAKNLRFLIRHGFGVPATRVCPWDPGQDCRLDDDAALERLRIEVASR